MVKAAPEDTEAAEVADALAIIRIINMSTPAAAGLAGWAASVRAEAPAPYLFIYHEVTVWLNRLNQNI